MRSEHYLARSCCRQASCTSSGEIQVEKLPTAVLLPRWSLRAEVLPHLLGTVCKNVYENANANTVHGVILVSRPFSQNLTAIQRKAAGPAAASRELRTSQADTMMIIRALSRLLILCLEGYMGSVGQWPTRQPRPRREDNFETQVHPPTRVSRNLLCALCCHGPM